MRFHSREVYIVGCTLFCFCGIDCKASTTWSDTDAHFQVFYNSVEAEQSLRSAFVPLQLALHATRLTAQQASARNARAPTVVILGNGAVQADTCRHLSLLLQHMRADPQLDVGRALFSRLSTEGAILIRCDCHRGFPVWVWALSIKHNSTGYLLEVEVVSSRPMSNLDVGHTP